MQAEYCSLNRRCFLLSCQYQVNAIYVTERHNQQILKLPCLSKYNSSSDILQQNRSTIRQNRVLTHHTTEVVGFLLQRPLALLRELQFYTVSTGVNFRMPCGSCFFRPQWVITFCTAQLYSSCFCRQEKKQRSPLNSRFFPTVIFSVLYPVLISCFSYSDT